MKAKMVKRVEMGNFLHDASINIELYRVRSERVNICCNTYENLYSSVLSALQHIIPLCMDWEREGFISLNKSEMNVVLHKLQSLFQEHFTLELGHWSYSTRSFPGESHIRCGANLVLAQSSAETKTPQKIGRVSTYHGPTGLGASNKHLEMNKPNDVADPVQHEDSDNSVSTPVFEPITPTSDDIPLIKGDVLADLTSEWELDIDKFFSSESVTTPLRALQDMTDNLPPIDPPQQINHVSLVHFEKPEIEDIHLKAEETADEEWDLKLDEITKRFRGTYEIKRSGVILKKRKVKSFGMSRQEKELIKSVLDEKPCEINKAERLKLLDRNLQMIKMLESLTKRIISFVDQPIKLLCDEI